MANGRGNIRTLLQTWHESTLRLSVPGSKEREPAVPNDKKDTDLSLSQLLTKAAR